MLIQLKKGRIAKYSALMLVAVLLSGMSTEKVEAKEDAVMEEVTVVENFDEIQEIYDGEDGIYVEYLDDGLVAEYDIDSKIEPNAERSLFGRNPLKVTYTYTFTRTLNTSVSTKSGILLWRSSISGKFGYDGTYAWGKSKSNSLSSDVKATRKITKNQLTTSKTKGNAYYYLNSTVKVKNYGTYRLEQYVYVTPKGDDGVHSYWKRM